MTSAAIFTCLRRRISPSMIAFPASLDLTDDVAFGCLREHCAEIISSFSWASVPSFQGNNSRCLIRRIEVLSLLLDSLEDCGGPLKEASSSILLFLKEIHMLLYRYKVLIDYMKGSSSLWLLLQNSSISCCFHHMNQEMVAILDVLPLDEINLPKDVKEQMELLRKQLRKSKLFVDKHADMLRLKFYSFLDDFESGIIPPKDKLYAFFVEKLGIYNVETCRAEIEFLKKQIVNDDGDIEPAASVLDGMVALMLYTRFLLFRFEDEDGELGISKDNTKRDFISAETANTTYASLPNDFFCPVSLDLMQDPVTVSTGQTYDRASITKWMKDGNLSCPKTGQVLAHTQLVPNRALRNLISQWCMANGILYDTQGNADCSPENSVASKPSKAAAVATKATESLLVQQLEYGTLQAKRVAAKEIRLLSRIGKENRASIGQAGAIPLLSKLLSSADASTQENSITALLNLSIHDMNKRIIMDLEGCLCSIVEVLSNGQTTDARENAAATLFSLSIVHDYKRVIAEENGAISALIGLLRNGTPRGKHDAVTALFNLSTHPENCTRILESEAIPALVTALEFEGVSEDAASILSMIAKQPMGAEAVAKEDSAIARLAEIVQCGTPRGKEKAVSALLEVCQNGGIAAMEGALKGPFLVSSLHRLLCNGTKRAKRKAASLVRIIHRGQYSSFELSSAGFGYATLETALPSEAFSISVPVL